MTKKYIDAEKLTKAIEDKGLDCSFALKMERLDTLALIDELQQELPSNLDEAAEDSWAVYEYRESPKGLYSTCYVDGFKAGAEWMKEQMLKEAVEADVNIYRDLVANESWAEFVVQMPTNNLGDKVRIIIVKED